MVRPARSVAGFLASRRGPAVNRRKVARILLPISPSPPAAARPAVAMTHRSGRRAPARMRRRSALPWDRGLVAATSIGLGVDAGISGRTHVRFLDGGSGSLLSGAWLARTLAFPILLIILVIGFVLVQDRIDRRDPKLALAPVGADQLTFS